MTWMVVGLVLAVGLTVVAIACVRTAVRAGASKR
jgi:heme/copper-type cytochrome/quinol oxidase subunit 4